MVKTQHQETKGKWGLSNAYKRLWHLNKEPGIIISKPLDTSFLNQLSNEMVTYLYVPCATMEYRVLGHCNCRLIITEDRHITTTIKLSFPLLFFFQSQKPIKWNLISYSCIVRKYQSFKSYITLFHCTKLPIICTKKQVLGPEFK